MPKKQKKQLSKVKSTISKKYLLFFGILVAVLCITLIQVQHSQTYVQHASSILGCGDVGDPGNEDGVGKYCTQGGGQCQGTGSPICSADIEPGQPGLCSKSCNTDADCGTGAVCFQDTLGKGCEPVVCEATPVPKVSVVPSQGCLGPGCVPSGSPAPTTSTQQPTQAPTASPTPTTGGGGNFLQLLLQFFLQIIQFFANLFK